MVHVPFCLGTMKQSSSHSPWQPDSPGIPKHSRRLILKRSDTESFLAQMPTRWLRARNNGEYNWYQVTAVAREFDESQR